MRSTAEKRQRKLFNLVKKYYKKNKFDYIHDLSHIKRVIYWTKIISKREKADLSLMMPAAILHDTAMAKYGDYLHARKGEIFCRQFLKKAGYNRAEIKQIGKIIRMHSTDDPIKSRTLEGDVLFDADKMDAVGPIGLIRHIFDQKYKGSKFNEIANGIIKWKERRIKNYGALFFTKTGKKLGSKRIKYMIDVCKKINKDLKRLS